ncbi:MAG TPA: type II toxin-antitoxin system RelE/ParE family toxin [Propionibacteriaceae bacterium]|jgi:hypothetical protein|nr:type II toxin-antitoxin system RelE/ParE family toxin [Propionibacteriaceae bacterium]
MSETLSLTAYEFIVGPLLDNPHRAGKRLRPPLDDRHSARRGTYRVIYRINKDQRRVTVVGVIHRSDCLSVIGAARATGPWRCKLQPACPISDIMSF